MKKRFHLVAGTVIAGATLSSGALAQSVESCDSILSSYESYLQSQPEYAEAYRLEYPACFGSSSSATQQINATSFTQASAISRAIGQRNRGSSGPTPVAAAGITGLSAG